MAVRRFVRAVLAPGAIVPLKPQEMKIGEADEDLLARAQLAMCTGQ